MHPATNDERAHFAVFARGGVAFALRGEVDAVDGDRFARALARVPVSDLEGVPVIDATDVGFLDHRALLRLAERVRGTGRVATLRCRSTTPARLVELLELEEVLRVEVEA
jgi:anti-anti-sigma regulatory factor